MIKKQLFIIVFLMFFKKIHANETNQLVKAFWHIGNLRDNVAFYFKIDPSIKLISKKNEGNMCQEIYQIPKSKISDVAQDIEMLKKINEKKHPFYRINVNDNSGSVEIKIVYDTKFVKKVVPMSFNAISSFKGINFTIIHSNIKGFLKFPQSLIGKPKDSNRPNVILDFGHGGEDSGAIGTNNVPEKEIVFLVGMKLKKLLEDQNYNVFLTRNKDKFIPLDQRTTMANLLGVPSIFISIHANHSHNLNASGIESYYADSSLLNRFNFKDNQILIGPVINKVKDERNKLFATTIHESVYKKCKELNKNLIDRKTKKSISQILLGTEMLTALLELGFVSNPKECQLLCNAEYQQAMAQGIFDGIESFFSKQNS